MKTTSPASPVIAAVTVPELPTAASKYSKMKILVIDDEPVNVALLEGILGDSGYTRVQALTDARDALTTCGSFEPDLILLDLMMPYVDGLTILESLRSQNSEIFLPVLVLTADISEQTKLRALRTGATDFLLKPFDQVEVLLRIANLLEIRRLHVQLDTQRAAFEEALHASATELRQAQGGVDRSKSWAER